ncbi:MAG: hypothetical protein M1389_09355 [Chloroflexi bacterium]|nr:hypothetical protein [Chloroflexota bacterium]
MSDPRNALVALVHARRGDATLGSALAAAAGRITAEAQERVRALRCEARRLRRQAWLDLQSAKSDFEASRQRAAAIRSMELDEVLKTAALRASSADLDGSRRSLRKAADAVERAVAAARLAEAQAEMVARRAEGCPEVVAFEALLNASCGLNRRDVSRARQARERVSLCSPAVSASAAYSGPDCHRAPDLACTGG